MRLNRYIIKGLYQKSDQGVNPPSKITFKAVFAPGMIPQTTLFSTLNQYKAQILTSDRIFDTAPTEDRSALGGFRRFQILLITIYFFICVICEIYG